MEELDYVIKYRSIVCIRNLLQDGAKILDHLKIKQFIGGEDNDEKRKRSRNIFKKYRGKYSRSRSKPWQGIE